MIDGEAIEVADRQLVMGAKIAATAIGKSAIFSRAQVQPEAFDQYVSHQWETLRQWLPDLDPRLEPSINTMLRHFFLVGCIAGRNNAIS
jgi:hypothetical protein